MLGQAVTAQRRTKSEKPRSFPPMVTVTTLVELVTASSWPRKRSATTAPMARPMAQTAMATVRRRWTDRVSPDTASRRYLLLPDCAIPGAYHQESRKPDEGTGTGLLGRAPVAGHGQGGEDGHHPHRPR